MIGVAATFARAYTSAARRAQLVPKDTPASGTNTILYGSCTVVAELDNISSTVALIRLYWEEAIISNPSKLPPAAATSALLPTLLHKKEGSDMRTYFDASPNPSKY